MSDILEWARREVEIACKKEREDSKDKGFDYGAACYMSALKALQSLAGDGHSGFSIGITKSILNRLIDWEPLTPIEDTDDIWNLCGTSEDEVKMYQCSRMSSLFKDVYPDGTVKYTDNDCYICININNHHDTYRNGFVGNIINEMFPITMPYFPGNHIKVYCEEFLTNKFNGDFDTFGVLYALKEEGGEQKKIEINRYFREPVGEETGNWTEISEEEYMQRKRNRIVKGE